PETKKEPPAWGNPVEASRLLQQQDQRASPPLPRIVSAHSLNPHFLQANSFPILSKLSCFVNEGENNTSGEISPFQAPPAVPTALLSQAPGLPNNPNMVNYSGLAENENMSRGMTSSFCIRPNSEMPVSEEIGGNRTGRMNYPTLFRNNSGQDSAYSPLSTPSTGLSNLFIIIENPSETSMENNSGTVNSSVLDNDCGPHATSPSISIPPSFAYLGDPRRKVRVLQAHLVAAQKKIRPEHAACYLVRVLFSKEVLINSSVGVNVQGRQPLDPNKLAAIREYLAVVFRSYDLREYGRDWKACLFNINSLIRYLYYKYRRASLNNVGRHKHPTNADAAAAASAGQGDESGGDGGEGSSQIVPQASPSSTQESGDSQQRPDAAREGTNEPFADNTAIPYEALDYLGNPRRNIQMPHLVLNVAKGKSSPELAARYLLRNLFTEDVLIRSTVYGDLGHGMSALNTNRINALRGLLHVEYV
uniref:BEN domain-containing protein n=1 Tax=Otolemur garnettii TaxID=30611 RepID=H0X7K6_OTOGA